MMQNSIQSATDLVAKLRARPVTGMTGQAGVDPHYVEDPDVATIVENCVKTGRNCHIWGPPGSGKTTLVQNVCARMGRETEEFNCDGETSTESLIGKLTRGADGSITVQYGKAVRAWTEGRVLLINEPERAMADIMSSLYQFLETNRKYVHVVVGAPETFERHGEFCVISTGNTNLNLVDAHLHAGSKQLPQAYIDRFAWFPRMTYLPADKETDVIVVKTGMNRTLAQTLVEIAQESRISEDLEKPMSTRTLLDWCTNMMTTGWDALKVAEKSFLQTYTEEEAALIREIVEGKL